MKRTSAHHKTVAVPLSTVATGYGGSRQIRAAGKGWWLIVGAVVKPSDDVPPGHVFVTVMQDPRGGK